jgi:hypothetical protein
MEDVLDVYHRPYDPARPVVALDDQPVQLLGDTREPIPCKPGEPVKQDHEYKRNGTANIFCAFEPLGNFRRLKVTERVRSWTLPRSSKNWWTSDTKTPRRSCW